MHRKPIYQKVDICEPLNKLTFESCESLQDMLLNKFPNTSKEEIYQLVKEWIRRYHVTIYIPWRL